MNTKCTKLLKQAKENYPKNSLFYSASGNLKSPLRVTHLRYSESKDLNDEIEDIENELIAIWNIMYPKKFANKFSKLNLKDDEFFHFTKRSLLKLRQLREIQPDIVEDNGGIIFDGLTETWAKKYE